MAVLPGGRSRACIERTVAPPGPFRLRVVQLSTVFRYPGIPARMFIRNCIS